MLHLSPLSPFLPFQAQCCCTFDWSLVDFGAALYFQENRLVLPDLTFLRASGSGLRLGLGTGLTSRMPPLRLNGKEGGVRSQGPPPPSEGGAEGAWKMCYFGLFKTEKHQTSFGMGNTLNLKWDIFALDKIIPKKTQYLRRTQLCPRNRYGINVVALITVSHPPKSYPICILNPPPESQSEGDGPPAYGCHLGFINDLFTDRLIIVVATFFPVIDYRCWKGIPILIVMNLRFFPIDFLMWWKKIISLICILGDRKTFRFVTQSIATISLSIFFWKWLCQNPRFLEQNPKHHWQKGVN